LWPGYSPTISKFPAGSRIRTADYLEAHHYKGGLAAADAPQPLRQVRTLNSGRQAPMRNYCRFSGRHYQYFGKNWCTWLALFMVLVDLCHRGSCAMHMVSKIFFLYIVAMIELSS